MCNYDVEVDKARVRSDVLEHLEELGDLMRVHTNLMALSIRMTLNPPETEEDKHAIHEKLDALSEGGYFFSE